MWVRKKDYDKNVRGNEDAFNDLYLSVQYLKGWVEENKHKLCDHKHIRFYCSSFMPTEYSKACLDCQKILETYETEEEVEKAELLHNKQKAERKLKEANEAIAKNEKKNK